MVKPLSLYLVLTCFSTDMVLDLPLFMHAWTDLKSILLDFVVRKVLPFTNKNPWLAPHFGGVWPQEGARVSLGWSCGALGSF